MAYEDGYRTSYYYDGQYVDGIFQVTGAFNLASDDTLSGGEYTLPEETELYFDSGQQLDPVELIGYASSGYAISIYGSYRFYSDDISFTNGQQIPLTTTGVVEVTPDGIAAVCFMEGTRIACPEGERLVEDIAIGDLVLTASGEALPVRWIGRQAVATVFADPLTRYPIRISAGALGHGLPRRDLFVSPTHALLVEGLLVQARALLNGTTIVQVRPQKSRFSYYHLEFERHAVVLAEGMPAESFVDSNESRRRFDNYAEFEALYGPDAPVAEPSDLPRVTVSRQLPRRIKAKLAAVKAEGTEAGAAEAA